ncbi:MAG: hypothetical protein AB7U41_01920 [Dongiaceae bacterium]
MIFNLDRMAQSLGLLAVFLYKQFAIRRLALRSWLDTYTPADMDVFHAAPASSAVKAEAGHRAAIDRIEKGIREVQSECAALRAKRKWGQEVDLEGDVDPAQQRPLCRGVLSDEAVLKQARHLAAIGLFDVRSN